jgi:hypothetical protein
VSHDGLLVLPISTFISLTSDGTCGCHAGLISIVAKELSELQEIYENHIYFMHKTEIIYKYDVWADTLADFLGFEKRRDLEDWAEASP